jgi:MFS family permease
MPQLVGAAPRFNAAMRLIADIVPPERLQAANSLRAFARSIGNIAGPALAGVIVVAASPGWGWSPTRSRSRRAR